MDGFFILLFRSKTLSSGAWTVHAKPTTTSGPRLAESWDSLAAAEEVAISYAKANLNQEYVVAQAIKRVATVEPHIASEFLRK